MALPLRFCLALLHILFFFYAKGQPKIHAHNDYEKSRPLYTALENRASYIEADVFLADGQLVVAHSREGINAGKTLWDLYLQPIIDLFNKNNRKISADVSYRLALVIDIKENSKEVLDQLIKTIKKHRAYFDRRLNGNAVELIISGERGNMLKWKNYPSYIFFDGRPYELYDGSTLKRVAMISDNYLKYLPANKDSGKLKEIIEQVHLLHKPVRFWASPDNEKTWKILKELGVDIINTDKVEACRKFLSRQ